MPVIGLVCTAIIYGAPLALWVLTIALMVRG